MNDIQINNMCIGHNQIVIVGDKESKNAVQSAWTYWEPSNNVIKTRSSWWELSKNVKDELETGTRT